MSTALRTYFRGHNLVSMRDDPAGKLAYYHFDHQGTTQCLSDSTGAVTDRFASDAWGVQVKRTGSSGNRAWYIGNLGYVRQVDQVLDYIRARYSASAIARWLSIDLLRALRLSTYVYVGNRPTAWADLSGREGYPTCPPFCGGGGRGGGGANTPVLSACSYYAKHSGCLTGANTTATALWTIQWSLAPMQVGYVVQKVTKSFWYLQNCPTVNVPPGQNFNLTKYNPNPNTPPPSGAVSPTTDNLTYYEVWLVQPNIQNDVIGFDPGDLDCFGDYGLGCKGVYTTTGTAMFVSGPFNQPKDWKGVSNAGALISGNSDPSLVNPAINWATANLKHSLALTYYCPILSQGLNSTVSGGPAAVQSGAGIGSCLSTTPTIPAGCI